jgi:hypothetical protein
MPFADIELNDGNTVGLSFTHGIENGDVKGRLAS